MHPVKMLNELVGGARCPAEGEQFYAIVFVKQEVRIYKREHSKKLWRRRPSLDLPKLTCNATQIELVGKEAAFNAVKEKFLEAIGPTWGTSALKISETDDIAVIRVFRR